MRLAFTVLVVTFAVTGSALAAEPVYIDQLMETPLETLQQQFPRLRSEGCYRIGPDRFLTIDINRKDRKPSRVALASTPPCKRPEEGPALEVRERAGVALGDKTRAVLETMGRPDAAAPPEPEFKRLGEMEYFYICQVSEGCARHTSVFMREGVVTAIAAWYSE